MPTRRSGGELITINAKRDQQRQLRRGVREEKKRQKCAEMVIDGDCRKNHAIDHHIR